jgi:hypothetical protein
MGCCGGIKKGKRIVLGILMNYAKVECPETSSRIAICRTCEKLTWLTRREWTIWLWKNGIRVLKNISQLEILPELPKKPKSKNGIEFCRVCKCFLEGKTRVEDERCPLNKW